MPLIEHAHAEDFDALADAIKSTKWDWMIMTSPEAAKTFLEGKLPGRLDEWPTRYVD